MRHISDARSTASSAADNDRAARVVTQASYDTAGTAQSVSSAVRWQPDRASEGVQAVQGFQPQFKAAPPQPQQEYSQPQAAAPQRTDVFAGTGDAARSSGNASESSAVTLRWISKDAADNGGQPSTQFPSEPAFSDVTPPAAQTQPVAQVQPASHVAPASNVNNSLRPGDNMVRQAAYQAEVGGPGGLQFGDTSGLPDLPPSQFGGAAGNGFQDGNTLPDLPDLDGNSGGFGLGLPPGNEGDLPSPPESAQPRTLPTQPSTNPPTTPREPAPRSPSGMDAMGAQGGDVLDSAEAAPAPESAQSRPRNPFLDDSPSDTDPRQPQGGDGMGTEPEEELERLPNTDDDQELELPDRASNSSSEPTCSELRERIRQRPISALKLNTAPVYGEGLRSLGDDNEQSRMEFASSSPVREWRDVSNKVIVRGRMIDMRNEQVVLDVGGSEMAIDLIKLSDSDVRYVGSSWNIPASCGVGNVPFEGRQFVASTVQFTAPGNCHKPLYFQQVQLERYGHDAGPVMQPLISTAHFFGNIAVLPYNMGIHPPNECQYSLGYFRPGNCAPYMLQPIPISLRGALTQASFTTGLSGLIP